MTAEEQLAAVTMQALNASKKLSRSQPHAGGSSEGTGVLPGVPDESTVILITSSEGTCTKSGVPDEEMKDAEDAENWKDDEEIINAEKTDVTKGDLEQARKLPLTSSSLSMSSSFVTPAKTPLPPPSVFTITHVLQQTTTPILTPPITIVALAATTVPDPFLVPAAKDEYLGSSRGDALQKVLHKQTKELIQQSSQKDVSEIIKIKQEQAAKEIMPILSPTPYNQATESVKEATHELTMGDEEPVQENVNDVDEPQDGEAALKNDWFKQPPRPPTSAPEWNKCQVNNLKLDKITKAYVVGPVYNLLKGTYQSSIKLKYNMEEFFKVQHKLFHLSGEVIVDLAVALRMFTRSVIIKKRIEDVEFGVESYQKKLNITKPQKDFPRILSKELYTPSFDPLGFVYEYLSHRKRLMRADELYKFLNGTLKKVCDTLHHRLLNF
nr:hypothetical protein [Tanacetum cinerariifolium]